LQITRIAFTPIEKKNSRPKILPGDAAKANVADMLYIAVGLTVALVGADLLDLTKRKTTLRGPNRLL